MKLLVTLLALSFAASTALAADIPGEISCDKGENMPKVKALVAKAKAAVKANKEKALKEITDGSKDMKDGDFYVFVYKGGTVEAHGFNAAMVGKDLTNVKDADGLQYVENIRRMAAEKGSGCFKYKFPNPAKGGQVENKISYIETLGNDEWIGVGTYLIK
jgi:cytochrome c